MIAPMSEKLPIKGTMKSHDLILMYVDDYGVFKSKNIKLLINHHEKENYLYLLILIGLQSYQKLNSGRVYPIGGKSQGDISILYHR